MATSDAQVNRVEDTIAGWWSKQYYEIFIGKATTFESLTPISHKYLAYLGFEPPNPKESLTAALKITKSRKRRRRPGRVERNVVMCYVLGAPGSGKSSLLNAFLNRPYEPLHYPTIKPRRAVNSVELPGGRQVYLILEELGELEPAILENKTKLDACDLLCYAYDSSDPDSFSHIVDMRAKHPHLDELPSIYTGLKADKDKTTQRSELQPDEYTASLNPSSAFPKMQCLFSLGKSVGQSRILTGLL
ncbi:P-loop containing nucleoside triphosphate hydrolase protein [Emericellopsis atlantica]|uniref:P-loop containing nucleoside triphosphate hydrolase protein n=1 Tax=Emericellopsis atlantica TaxID=2614577 RepID=A0A9P7ZDX8_9HYPO|nr:P-loop containing nucleoside triphosphate hydrolase protein [Emericellopsis atlantica]KAG9249678.1 P-loop containing nucleoside triphosphate hydrolase protein [Emericellopsis atlantica]